MIGIIGIILACLIILAGCIIMYNISENKVCASFALLAIGFSFVVIASVINSYPTALDVYRGKTTLEITYKDGVPVDSVVVYKDSL